jgi:hypothetical protein
MERQMSRTPDLVLVGCFQDGREYVTRNNGSDYPTCSGADPNVGEVTEMVINDPQFTARKETGGLNMNTRSVRLILTKDFYEKLACQNAIE